LISTPGEVNIQLRRLPDRVRRYLLALAALTGASLLAALLLRIIGAKAAIAVSLLGDVVFLGAAWLGYGPGIVVCFLITFVVPPLLVPGRPVSTDLWHFGILIFISLLVSRISVSKRRSEALLRDWGESLEVRVAERTRKLNEQQEQLREQAQLLELANDGIFSVDPGGNVHYWNRGAEVLYGYPSAEAQGQNIHALLRTTFPYPLSEIDATLQISGAWLGELVHTRKDQSRITVMSRWALRRDASGQPCGWLEINTDITAQRRMEDQLRHAQRMEAVGRLAGGISHDFNNLLTVINGYAELAMEEVPDPARESIRQISDAGRRAAELTRGLLTFSRHQIVRPTTVDLNAVVTSIEKMLRRLIGGHIFLTSALAPDLWPIEADSSQLDQIMVNLTANARDAMPEGGKIVIGTTNITLDESYCFARLGLSPGDYVILAVSDTGKGMDKETQAHIFEPFFTTKPEGQGTGLGLATVYGIVQQCGGAISVYSEPGRGTTFKVYLPKSNASNSQHRQQSGTPPTAPLAHSGAETVLLVEDDDSLRRLASVILKKQGYSVIEASGAVEALEICRRRSGAIDLVLSDLIMPGMNGHQLTSELRRLYPKVKVVLMSGYAEHTMVSQIAADPGIRLVSKPFTTTTLTAALEAAFRK
jgi:PAS domain S-box-containing protein